MRRHGPESYKVSGILRALVTQTCVVSLEPFETFVSAPIDVEFAPSRQPAGEPASRNLRTCSTATCAGLEDPPDATIDGQIDLGALAAEFLALNLDPYPRKPGATFKDTNFDGEAATDSPFAVLRRRS